jgi:hypothetical protein
VNIIVPPVCTLLTRELPAAFRRLPNVKCQGNFGVPNQQLHPKSFWLRVAEVPQPKATKLKKKARPEPALEHADSQGLSLTFKSRAAANGLRSSLPGLGTAFERCKPSARVASESLQSEQHPIERLLCQLTSWPIARIRRFDFWLRRVLTGLNDIEQLPNKPQSVHLVVMLAGREAEKL